MKDPGWSRKGLTPPTGPAARPSAPSVPGSLNVSYEAALLGRPYSPCSKMREPRLREDSTPMGGGDVQEASASGGARLQGPDPPCALAKPRNEVTGSGGAFLSVVGNTLLLGPWLSAPIPGPCPEESGVGGATGI